jgi:hypothetical protein
MKKVEGNIQISSKDPYTKLYKIVVPLADLQPNAQIRSKMAVTSMDFTESGDFLQMCV